MTTDRDAERMLELEESAEGVDLFRGPGGELAVEDARDQAEAAGPTAETASGSDFPWLSKARSRRTDLRQAMERLENAVAGPSPAPDQWIGAVEDGLVALRDALDAHISEVEAPDGLLADTLSRAPRLAPSVERLRREHRQLITSWDRAALALAEHPADKARVRRRVVSLLGRLAIHRQGGADLVYEAYNVDIGGTG